MPDSSETDLCPCGSSRRFDHCCGRFLSGADYPSTAEELMRSRYCAFVLRNGAYLSDTIAAENRGAFDAKSIERDQTDWIGLEIIDRKAGGLLDQTGQVEFIARFNENGQHHHLHERSNFERRAGKWVYVDGDFPYANGIKPGAAPQRVGRNDPCPCGSGKKFKKCCG
ncbi:MAG TPA: hypothetical protein DEF21_04845 [Thalassospira lucentensis]|uniref:YchJ-like middle NTF2-like domain-containing protein n=2 Tax=Thalassospira lucentensis TaxID=168935 RepID=A0A358HPY9_9PROT|nr:YchJ family protein [Thalassospira lucentensis]HBU97221.1 hypothetical protein [Thalassospira lucentensis]HCW67466.1 hypothetical protein [Thalassospira lucentensis]